MGRSFGIVDEKVFEADFFLIQLKKSGTNFFKVRCYFNAFVSAARSITFCMQASLNDIDGFSEWYASKQKALKEIPEARFFNKVRSESQKTGWAPLSAGCGFKDRKGKTIIKHYFGGSIDGGSVQDLPLADAISACHDHLVRLIKIVFDCYVDFGYLIDPDQYYSVGGIKKTGRSIEELEVELGFEPGWTNIREGSLEDRLSALRRHEPGTQIDAMFKKYLGKTRAAFLINKSSARR